MRRKLIILLAVLGMTAFVSKTKAQTVTLYLVTTNNPASVGTGTWQIYANVSDDNDGLSDYDVDLFAGGGTTIISSTKKAPVPNDGAADTNSPDGTAQYADETGGPMGFNTLSGNGTKTAGAYPGATTSSTGNSLISIAAGQNTVYAAPDDATYDMGVLVGVGQENSSQALPAENGTQGPGGPTGNTTTPEIWAWTAAGTAPGGQTFAGTLLQQGTYSVNAAGGTLSIGLGNLGAGTEAVLADDPAPNQPWTLDEGIEAAVFVNGTPGGLVVGAVPEPASIGLIVAGLGMMATGRGMRRKAA
jgi:hypothetical protein